MPAVAQIQYELSHDISISLKGRCVFFFILLMT